jgi:hypothetical protein
MKTRCAFCGVQIYEGHNTTHRSSLTGGENHFLCQSCWEHEADLIEEIGNDNPNLLRQYNLSSR